MASELRDDFGDPIEVDTDEFEVTTPDGSTSPAGAVIVTFRPSCVRLSGERLDAFREALDRAAMPGQEGATDGQ